MKEPYSNWITERVSRFEDAYGKCAELTLAMVREFPELVRVRGHYYDAAWGKRAHWWLVTPEGEIVDPTALQFPSRGAGHYEPWKEGAPEPTGRCYNCGEETFRGNSFCSAECYNDTRNAPAEHGGLPMPALKGSEAWI